MRGKLVDRTATYPPGKVLKLDRWAYRTLTPHRYRWGVFRSPMDASFHLWKHVAFTGGSINDFLNAQESPKAFWDVVKWLYPGDTICWWFSDSKEWIQKLVPVISNRQLVLTDLVANFLGEEHSYNPYRIGKNLYLDRPEAKHDSRNDVEMMRRVLEHIKFPQPIPENIPKKEINTKPDPKYDVVVSLPIYSTKRYGESTGMLKNLCNRFGYKYWEDAGMSYMETEVGIWKVNTNASPYRLDHINLAMAYKGIDEIISHIGPTVDIVERIIPIYNFKAAE